MTPAARPCVRVVFDVNVFVRAALGSAQAVELLATVAGGSATILTSDLLVREFAACVRKPRLAPHVDWEVYNHTLALLALCGESVPVSPPFPPCRDPDDGYLLAMADSGAADYLVTHDLDLLSLRGIGSCQIVTPAQFRRGLGDV